MGSPAEVSLTEVEPAPPSIRFTQQDPGIGPDFGILMICAGSGVAARIGTIPPVYGALGFRSGSAACGRYVEPLTLTGQRVGVARDHSSTGRASVGVVQDGGSDVAVMTIERLRGLEPLQLELSSATDEDGNQIVSVTGELDIATAEQAYIYLSDVIDAWPAPVSVDLSG